MTVSSDVICEQVYCILYGHVVHVLFMLTRQLTDQSFLMNLMNCNCIQEDSEKTGKVTSAGMYFLHFQVYRMDSTVNAVCEYQPIGQIH